MFQLQPDYTTHLAPTPAARACGATPLIVVSSQYDSAPAVFDKDLAATELLNTYTAHLAPPQTHQHEPLSPCLRSFMTSLPASAGWVSVG